MKEDKLEKDDQTCGFERLLWCLMEEVKTGRQVTGQKAPVVVQQGEVWWEEVDLFQRHTGGELIGVMWGYKDGGRLR